MQMLKVVAISLALVGAGACKDKKKTDGVAPDPVAGSGSGGSGMTMAGSGSAENAMTGSGSAAGSGMAGSGSAAPAGCKVAITIDDDHVEWESADGAVKGSSSISDGKRLDGNSLKDDMGKVAPGCVGELSADPTAKITYQLMITVMDTAIAGGLKDISLVGPSKTTPVIGDAPKGPPPPLKDMPLIIISKTEVKVGDKVVGKPDAAELMPLLGPVMTETRKTKPGTTAILQADENTGYDVIAVVVDAASAAGYTNVLFAVKNK